MVADGVGQECLRNADDFFLFGLTAEQGFTPILEALLQHGDHYRHMADLASYAHAHQRLGELYADQPAWTRKGVLNLAASGRFSSDRAIAGYAKEI